MLKNIQNNLATFNKQAHLENVNKNVYIIYSSCLWTQLFSFFVLRNRVCVYVNLEGAWEAEESRMGTGTVKAGGPALSQNPVTAPRPGTMETPAGAKPCQHTGQHCCRHTHTLIPYSNNAGHSPAFQTDTHTLNYSSKELWPLTHRQEDQLLHCINSWSIPQILMMFTVYCCVSTWLTTCFHNKWTERISEMQDGVTERERLMRKDTERETEDGMALNSEFALLFRYWFTSMRAETSRSN